MEQTTDKLQFALESILAIISAPGTFIMASLRKQAIVVLEENGYDMSEMKAEYPGCN